MDEILYVSDTLKQNPSHYPWEKKPYQSLIIILSKEQNLTAEIKASSADVHADIH